MNTPFFLKNLFFDFLHRTYSLNAEATAKIDFVINVDPERSIHGDISSNAALVLSKQLRRSPQEIAKEIVTLLNSSSEQFPELISLIKTIEIAGPGFLNLKLSANCWASITKKLISHPEQFFIDPTIPVKKILVEFVSANPTGPLHLGHGRGGIIGDVLIRIGRFLGYQMTSEFYINDAGSQMIRLGESLRVRIAQKLGEQIDLPENGYAGTYLIEIAEKLIQKEGVTLLQKPLSFFIETAQTLLLAVIKHNLEEYRITFDNWFSEKSLHTSGVVMETLTPLLEKNIIYEADDALWFRSTEFGDDKDRVIRKQNGELTYIAADIAYHKNKFDRGYDQIINILGQDHHGYVMRLKGTIAALGYDAEKLHVILYQLVSIKKGETLLKMSKRAGNFEQLGDIISLVGADVARFFYLNRKADAHLDFDLDVALKQTDENPVFYIHYAYVRTGSILKRASEHTELQAYINTEHEIMTNCTNSIDQWDFDELLLLKKVWSLHALLPSIMETYQTHTLAYYTYELAQQLHHYYAQHHVIDSKNLKQSAARLTIIQIVRSTLSLCLELLGLSKPEVM